jgi:molybdate transport system ATP-binding protein
VSLALTLSVARAGFTLDVRMEVAEARFVALVGPSGAGKSTVLRAVAGFERAVSGVVRFDGETWQGPAQFVPAHLRPIGFVFQDAALFPHLDVMENLRFGLTRVSAAQRRITVDDVVDLLGIAPLLGRPTATLSGGERQRVALGRALLTSPRLLLCDEPLASLDAESRAQIIPYLRAVQRALRLPTLYVTHTQPELMRLAEDVVYLEAGRVRAQGPINDVLTDPALPLSRGDDAGAALDLPVVALEPEYHLMQLALGEARLTVSHSGARVGERVRVIVRARDVGVSTLRPEQTSILNVVGARVLAIELERDPAHRLVRLATHGHVLLARVTLKAVLQLGLAPGGAAYAHVKSVALAE